MKLFLKNGLSLKTQFISLIVLFALLSFLGRLYISIDTMRDYLQQQMSIHAQDTANSLGLSITHYLAPDDRVVAQTMVSAIFDAGYYQKIEFIDPQGKVLITRSSPKSVESVPTWFIDAFELNTPIRSSEVNSGWRIAGTLYVTSHPGISYLKLWEQSKNNFYGAILVLILCIIITIIILSFVLQPLKKLTHQAKLVTQKQFTLNSPLPITKELRTVTLAINNMVSNLHHTFDSLTKQTQRLTSQLFIDKLTQCGNRRAFENHYIALSKSIDEEQPMTLFLITLPSLPSINLELNYQSGDEYVLTARDIILKTFSAIKTCRVFRIAGGSFIVIAPFAEELLIEHKSQLNDKFKQQSHTRYALGFAHSASLTLASPNSLSHTLSTLDIGSTITHSQQVNNPVDNTFSVSQWKNVIHEILESAHIEYSLQPVLNTKTKKAHYFEVFAKFNHEGKLINNSHLFAMAERLDLTIELDKKLINDFIENKIHFPNWLFALNISHATLYCEEFLDWLVKFAKRNPCIQKNLTFEINESSLLHDVAAAKRSIQCYRRIGISVCIEHFGTSLTSFKYLQGLDITFVKLDGSYIQDVNNNTQSQFFINTVNTICHGFGIKVLACLIEDQDTFTTLDNLGCDGLQGQMIQSPVRMENDVKSFAFSPNILHLLN
ncbi:EAL domain-containing protein [Pseudoalteromonas sp. MMG010]|uniref:bifunctional diguanylate cyclase/phosphodiesterase n=1 Tax=Pseudoalteromonas sp. MMG010 TaxID=2822685 RepID=UPI001B39E4AD|nr:EAL domain-containing protein [Pseudoalteromonas sp. MMG010]MBQ4834150.1 EAL domain-containing protein [Pseudoalteromonas sp. MMG010]